MQFAKYKDDGILDKPSFMKEMKALIMRCSPDLTDNQRLKMDGMLISLYSLFDIDKNGILKADEVAAALCVLCKGSIASKIKFGMKIFSSTDTETEVKIKMSEFTEFLKWKKLVKQENDLKAENDEQSLVKKSAEMMVGRNPPSQQQNDLDSGEKSSESPVHSSVLSPEAAPFQPKRLNVNTTADLADLPSYSLHPVSGRDSLTSLIAESNSQERFVLILENISLI